MQIDRAAVALQQTLPGDEGTVPSIHDHDDHLLRLSRHSQEKNRLNADGIGTVFSVGLRFLPFLGISVAIRSFEELDSGWHSGNGKDIDSTSQIYNADTGP